MQLGTNADYLQMMRRGPTSSLMLKNDFRILRTIIVFYFTKTKYTTWLSFIFKTLLPKNKQTSFCNTNMIRDQF